MTVYRAYCSACDSEVCVRFDHGSDGEEATADCGSNKEFCGQDACPVFSRYDGRIVWESLEFVPGSPRAAGPRAYREAVRLVEQARRASLGRQARLSKVARGEAD